MASEKAVNFLKNKIKERLNTVKDQMGKYRYKLYIAMVDGCDDFDELREMAELDLQMDLFDYVRTEITPMLEELNLTLADIRRVDKIPDHLPNQVRTNESFDLTADDLEESLNDEDTDAAMAMLLMNRISSEPAEEKYRDKILDFTYEGDPLTANDVDEIDESDFDEDDGYSDIPDNKDTDDDDDEQYFDDLDELEDSLSDEDTDTEDSENDTQELEDSDVFIDIDELDGYELPEEASDKDKLSLSEDDIFSLDDEEGFGDLGEDEEKDILTEDEIFKDIDESEENDESDKSDNLNLTEDDIFKSLDLISEEQDDDGFGSLLDEEDDIEGIESDDEGFGDLSDLDNFGDDDTIEEDTEDSEDGDKDNSLHSDSDDDFDIDEEELDGFGEEPDSDSDKLKSDPYSLFDEDDEDLNGFLSEPENEPTKTTDLFSQLDDLDDELDSYSGEDDTPHKEKSVEDDLFADLDEDDIGIIDDTDDYFADNKPKAETKPRKSPDNAIVHTPKTPTRTHGIKPTTVFNNGTTRGAKTQSMFNLFNNIGIGSKKAAKKIKERTNKVIKSGFFDIGSEGDSEIDF